jgi:hypothetical protein
MKDIKEFFRQDVADLPDFSVFYSVRDSALEGFFMNRELTGQGPKAFEITFDSLIGWPETRRKNTEILAKYATECASYFYGNAEFQAAYLMTNGSSLPLKVVFDTDCAEKALYLKPFDLTRLIGLELYRMAEAPDYCFLFNDGIIAEEAQEGKHEFEIDGFNNENYKRGRIRMDIFSFYFGTDDLQKRDNYVVSPERVRIIDFDVATPFSDSEIEAIRRSTMQDLNIGEQQYEEIFAEENQLFIRRLTKDKIVGILGLMKTLGLAELGSYIGKKINQSL